MARKTLPDLGHLAVPGATFEVRVTPRAGREALETDGAKLLVRVTAPPEDGRANAAVQQVLAKALGVARTRLELVRGATSRDKLFRLD